MDVTLPTAWGPLTVEAYRLRRELWRRAGVGPPSAQQRRYFAAWLSAAQRFKRRLDQGV